MMIWMFLHKDDKILQEISKKLGEKLTTAKKAALTLDMDKILEQNLYVQNSPPFITDMYVSPGNHMKREWSLWKRK